MSVYKRPDSPHYWTEYRIDGVRFRSSTGEADKREARLAERRLKAEHKARLDADAGRRAAWGGMEPPSLTYVVARYWEEVGRFHEAAETTWTALEWLTDHFGPDTLLTDITGNKISEMVARRRGIRIKRDPKTQKLLTIPCETVKNATVNRYATEPLRKLFRRARDVWGYTIPYPRWGDYLLPEAEERVREASQEEEAAIINALGPDYGRLFRFMIAAGSRAGGAMLTWPQVDRINAIARVRNKSKNGQDRWYTLPLSSRAMAILDECEGHHPTHVFTYEARRTIGSRDENRRRAKGQRYPITDSGFKTEWRRLVHDSGIAPGFRRHDTRHTTGTRHLRVTGNLKATQKLLGHSRIETTTRYAHVLVEDVRDGMEAVDRAYGDAGTKPEKSVGDFVGGLRGGRAR